MRGTGGGIHYVYCVTGTLEHGERCTAPCRTGKCASPRRSRTPSHHLFCSVRMTEKRRRPPHDPDVEEPPRQRPFQRPRGESGYHPGAITRVSLTNFMSYSHASFCPGPRLNLILAPNGCGKSSIVAALCLGLAGSLKLLGKSTYVKDFIQRGKDNASLEIELCLSATRTVTIRRQLFANSSKWYIDGREKPEKDVAELVTEKLNIKLENLTQFLPQVSAAPCSPPKPRRSRGSAVIAHAA